MIENVMITRLSASGRRFSGAVGLGQDGNLLGFEAKSCVLATGGFAQVYQMTNNAAGTTGDGQALAYELRLPLKDMEFVQFYPTALGDHGRPMLAYEGFMSPPGAVLKNAAGEDIAQKHGRSDLSTFTRDHLARAIFLEARDGLGVKGGVIMDLSRIPPEKIASLRHLLPGGWTPEMTELVVSPTAHFCMGGIMTNDCGETEVAGLLAAGEVCGGAHGANRLAGNALAETIVMGGLAGEIAAKFAEDRMSPESLRTEIMEERARLEWGASGGTEELRDIRRKLKELMWNKVGIVREGGELQESIERIICLRSAISRLGIKEGREKQKAIEIQNMLLVSEMTARAALMRTESRGAHHRGDYPEEDNAHWFKNIVIRKGNAGMQFSLAPLSSPCPAA